MIDIVNSRQIIIGQTRNPFEAIAIAGCSPNFFEGWRRCYFTFNSDTMNCPFVIVHCVPS